MSTGSIDYNYMSLKDLNYDLNNTHGKPVYLKVVGKHNKQHVELVHGRLNTLIAKIACFFGVKTYDLQNISTVFEKQIKTFQESIATIDLPLEKVD
ncbi:MAG: hypothetical protein LLF94_08405, partial [Chlamydiales bacterium]|nr:hypothetical protein [Chlamydiales bacterium]